jgi:hypothetical protein
MISTESRWARFFLWAFLFAGVGQCAAAVVLLTTPARHWSHFHRALPLLAAATAAQTVIAGWLLGSSRGRRWTERLGAALPVAPAATSPLLGPSACAIAVVALVAAIVLAVDLWFSSQLGLLSLPPTFDGISYLLDAKRIYNTLGQAGAGAPAPREYIGVPAVLWWGLMLASFAFFGAGEWQAATARFWPTALLLLLVWWCVHRRAGRRWAVLAVLATALLPALSVSLRACGWCYATGQIESERDWYLADLRPDLLFAVLLLWGVAILVEGARNLTPAILAASGVFLGLALLAKPSGFPMVFLAWGATWLGVAAVNRPAWSPRFILGLGVWNALPAAVLAGPCALAGVAQWAYGYWTADADLKIAQYALASSDRWAELGYYSTVLPLWLGRIEGWVIVAAGFACLVASRLASRDRRGWAYLALAAIVYAVIARVPAKSLFIGLFYCLLVWLGALPALAAALEAWSERWRRLPAVIGAVAVLYYLVISGLALYGMTHWPADERAIGPANRAAWQALAADLKAHLDVEDRFVVPPIFGASAGLQFFILDERGLAPKDGVSYAQMRLEPDAFARAMMAECQAVVVLDDSALALPSFARRSRIDSPRIQALGHAVQRPDSGFRRIGTYRFEDRAIDSVATQSEGVAYSHRSFAVHLYVKNPPVTASLAPAD